MSQSPPHNDINIILIWKKEKKGKKKAIRINTNGDTISGNQGTRNSVNSEGQYKLVSKYSKWRLLEEFNYGLQKNNTHFI